MGTNARVVNRKSDCSPRRRRDGASFDADAREMRLDAKMDKMKKDFTKLVNSVKKMSMKKSPEMPMLKMKKVLKMKKAMK